MQVIYQDVDGSKELINIPPAYNAKKLRTKKLNMSTRRYSRRRIGLRAYALKRIKDLGIQEVVNELAGEEVVKELFGQEVVKKLSGHEVVKELSGHEVVKELSGHEVDKELSGQEQCKMQNEITVEGNFETEQSFAASISVIFDELEKTNIRKSDGKTKGSRTLSALKVQVAQNAASELSLDDNKMILETTAPSLTSNKLQRKIGNKLSMLLNCEAEKDFSASISEMFDELEKTNIRKSDDKTKGLCALSVLKAQAAQNAASGLFLDDKKMIVETTTLSSTFNEQQCKIQNKFSVLLNCGAEKDFSASISVAFDVLKEIDKIECKKEFSCLEEMQRGQVNTASDEEDYFVVEKVSNFEPKKEPICMDSLSIVNMEHVFNQIKAVADHSMKLNCSTHHLEIDSSTQSGLQTTLFLRCAMCNYRVPVYSHPADHTRMDINQCAVIGTIITGGGYAQMEQFLTALNLKSPTMRKYQDCHQIMIDALIRAAEIEMLAAAEEEKRLAIERGDVLPCGIPHIPVVADGCWMKRSYGTGRYNSPAGIGTIIGYHSKKVLFMGSRNKNCAICQCAKRKNTPPREHKCFKNWDRYQPSSKMESDTILEGFKTSIEKRGLIYSTLIADGDSSTYKRILDCDPYAGMVRVKKIECSNHLLRNFCKKMRDVVKKTPPGRYRKTVEGSIRLLRVGIQSAAKFRANENLQESQQIENLRADIINVPSHVFGEHKECQKLGYFCNSPVKEDEQNIVPELMRVGVYQRIQEILRPLLTHAESLLRNKNNNLVECFNGIVVKYIGGKRLNFSFSGSYFARCCAAVIQFNTKELLTRVTKVLRKEPSSIAKRLEARKKHMNNVNHIRPQKRHVRKLFCSTNDPDYGPNSLQPDMEQLAKKTIET